MLLTATTLQLLSGFFLGWYYMPEPGLVVEFREEVINYTRSGAEVFYTRLRGVDSIFILLYLHILKKFFLRIYETLDLGLSFLLSQLLLLFLSHLFHGFYSDILWLNCWKIYLDSGSSLDFYNFMQKDYRFMRVEYVTTNMMWDETGGSNFGGNNGGGSNNNPQPNNNGGAIIYDDDTANTANTESSSVFNGTNFFQNLPQVADLSEVQAAHMNSNQFRDAVDDVSSSATMYNQQIPSNSNPVNDQFSENEYMLSNSSGMSQQHQSSTSLSGSVNVNSNWGFNVPTGGSDSRIQHPRQPNF